LRTIECREVVERGADSGMVRAERLFVDRQRALVQRLGVRIERFTIE